MKPQTNHEMAKKLGVDTFKYQLSPTVFWEIGGEKFKAQLESENPRGHVF